MNKIILNWSGGIDSTAALFDLLNSQSHYVYIHHNVLKNWCGRGEHERYACRAILDHIKACGYENFQYIETTYEQPDFLQGVLDCYLHLGYISGVLCSQYKVERIMHPINQWDFDKSGDDLIRRAEDSIKICRLVAQNESIDYITPYAGLSKLDVYQKIPIEVRSLVWCCRTPVDGHRCGVCHACVDQNILKIKARE